MYILLPSQQWYNDFSHAEGEYEEKGAGHIVRSGSGTHTSATGTVYSGQWANDEMNGKGTMYNIIHLHIQCTILYTCMYMSRMAKELN